MKKKIKHKKEHNARKNPNVDKRYISLLATAAVEGNEHYLSKAIAYYNMGHKCDACDKTYEMCQCEGSRIHKFDKLGNVIQGICEQCRTDYCVCDYDIFNKDGSINSDKVKWTAIGLARMTLTFDQFKEFNRILELTKSMVQTRFIWRKQI